MALAEYDLATADAMLQAGRLLYVGFMCQQAIEKIPKACYVKQHGTTPPYTHNLLRLIAELSWKAELDARMFERIETLNSWYIESRYTEDIEALASTMTRPKASEVLHSTREIFTWLRSRL